MFLTPSEVQILTGYKQTARQLRFLAERRIPFTTDKAGRPVVIARNLNREAPKSQPNW